MICDIIYLKTYFSEVEDNEYWNSLLKTADNFIKHLCRRNLEYQEYEEEGETKGGMIIVKEIPIDEVLMLKINNEEISIEELKNEFRIRYNIGLIDVGKDGYYQIKYLGGLKEMPSDLKYACVLVIKFLDERIKQGILSRESLGSHSVDFLTDEELMRSVEMYIFKYRRLI